MRAIKTVKLIGGFINLLEIAGIIGVLLMTLLFQFVMHELPCPLCLLQRVGCLGIAYGFLLNFRFGFRPSHYSVVLMSGLFTSFVALRQIALHVIPGTGAYGSALLGFHLYTWSFITAMAIVIVTTVLLGLERQYHHLEDLRSLYSRSLTNTLFVLITTIIVINMVAVIFECGFHLCPDNPVSYQLLQKNA